MQVKKRMDRGDKFLLVDVREESEFAKDHLPGAIHLGKGIIERDIEARVPDLNHRDCSLLRRRIPFGAGCRQSAEDGLHQCDFDGRRDSRLAGERLSADERIA